MLLISALSCKWRQRLFFFNYDYESDVFFSYNFELNLLLT